MPVPSPLQTTVSLQAGETFFTRLKAGSLIHVASGEVSMSGPPSWMGGQLVSSRLTLLPGQLHIVADQGWVALAASDQGAADVQLIRAVKANWLATCAAALNSFVRRFGPLQMGRP